MLFQHYYYYYYYFEGSVVCIAVLEEWIEVTGIL